MSAAVGPDYALRTADRLGSLLDLQRQALEIQRRSMELLVSLVEAPERPIVIEGPPPPEPVSLDVTGVEQLLRQVLVKLDQLVTLSASPTRTALVRDREGKAVSSITEVVAAAG